MIPARELCRCFIELILISLTLISNQGLAQSVAGESGPHLTRSAPLEKLTRDVTAAALEKFGSGGLTADEIALTIIDLNDREHPSWASHRGQEPIYPASVVKLFYLFAAEHQMETGVLNPWPELERALHDMIVESSNDATHYVVDSLTGTN